MTLVNEIKIMRETTPVKLATKFYHASSKFNQSGKLTLQWR
jgi:hypothetical protein